ncbi:MAG: hypothetical protein NTY33_02905 [Candidatus Moranbacteria bacterium]|nr:hypothetical protein [Candidatus Moranbacteria bacterium]
MILKLNNLKKEILSGGIFRRIGGFLGGNIKKFVFLLFFILSGYCVYIWYAYAYNNQWSEKKKAEYLQTKDKEVTFNRKKFQDTIEREQKRAEEYQKTITAEKDIFGIK